MNLKQLIRNAETIAISGHVKPDGDCMGSCLGLYNYIKTWFPDKEVTVYLETFPHVFSFLSGADKVLHEFQKEKNFDLYFCLDCGAWDRLGFAETAYQAAKVRVCIDHHISNQNQDENYYIVPTASSTSELVYNLIEPQELTKEIAECLYLGIVHDTGVFQYSNAKPSTMIAAAALLEQGVQGYRIIEDTFYEKTYQQQKMLGKCLVESQLYIDDRVILATVSEQELKEYGITAKDLEGIASLMRNTRGVDVSAFIYELSLEEWKVSLRANDAVDVSEVAVTFGGGGHKKAAGFTLYGSIEEVSKQVLDKLKEIM